MNEWHMNFSGEKKKHTKKTHTHRFATILGIKKNSNALKNRSPIMCLVFFFCVWFRINSLYLVQRLGDGKRDKNTINFAASPPTPRKKTTTSPDTTKHNQYKNSVSWYKRCDIRTTIQSYAD